MYQALYRKYRPSSFDEIFGQENIVETLSNAIQNEKISHAYLFSGPRGTGKTSIAKLMAKIINCSERQNLNPCNQCVSCTQNNTDVIEIDAASNNGVDEIRELKNKINLVPTYGKYKIYIIDEVHMLTISAFNALLKTLEEPPKHIIFILATTEPHKIPMTILSRCQRFDFKRIPINAIYARLNDIALKENIEIEENAMQEIARISDGGMRDAINLLDQVNSYANDKITLEDVHNINGTISQYQIEEFFEAYLNRNLEFILKKINDYGDTGKNLIKLAQEYIYYLRNLLIYKKAPNYLIENNVDCTVYQKASQSMENVEIISLIKELNIAINDMKNSNRPRVNFEIVFINNMTSKNEINENKNIENLKPNIEERKITIENNIATATDSKIPATTIKNSKPIDYEELKQLRINNTLALLEKNQIKFISQEIIKIKPLLINPKYSQLVSVILDGKVKAASSKNVLFVYKYTSDAKIFNENMHLIDEIIYNGLEINYNAVAVDENEWEIIKNQYNSKKIKYEYKIESENESKTANSITEMFGQIIEYR